VEGMIKSKPGLIPASKVNMQAYQGGNYDVFIQSQETVEDKVVQLAHEFAQLHGIEALEGLLENNATSSNPLEGVIEGDEPRSNF
jgi:hypothetical protein